ncbi:hypothetical protein KPL78_09675 [Roseomonas sp. HJA6]|uniref:DUF732 domain-containing protein n=1 Tax=Roseomonas alba TaxID=2846776 RepID=A0ABS7A7L6_9PROT|nr:hypothetical protein [Neoroseomonas alba]MBW6398115.1 hypothetical protein [Neoroseomonas alba]
MIRAIVILLLLLGGLGAGVAWLGQHPPPGSAPARIQGAATPGSAPASGTSAALGTPFGDAVFRWRCTTGLKEAIGDRPGWSFERLASLCLCAADRLREDGPRDIILGPGDVAASLEAAEARLCRRP